MDEGWLRLSNGSAPNHPWEKNWGAKREGVGAVSNNAQFPRTKRVRNEVGA